MADFVDVYVVPVPRKSLDGYRKLAELARQVWLDHGALDYVEMVAEDVQPGTHTSFPQAVKLAEDEVVVVGWITFRSRAERDAINRKAIDDPRMAGFDRSTVPFDGKRMFWGGFVPLLKD